MNRREFLVRVGGTLIAVPVILQAVSCGDDSTGPAPGGTPGFDSTSETASSHTHSIRIQCTDLTSSSTIGYTSTNNSSHTHTVTLTAANLVTLAGGGTVDVFSSSNGGHDHRWIITKPTGVC